MMKVVRAVPGGYVGVWIAAVLVCAAAFEVGLLGFKRVESIIEPDSCMWDNLSKGD